MKIEIKIEGENIGEIIREVSKIIESNREEMRKLIKFFAHETMEAIDDKKILDRGADLYVKLNRAINWKYRQEK